jgi:2-polyprenyl-3-methyl-5-hydroxy-6-metoxy-1,4-benzoquinol methylase
MSITLRHQDGSVYVEQINTGKKLISVKLLNQDLFMPKSSVLTSYPIELIEHIMNVKGVNWLCDEIMRDEDSAYNQRQIELNIFPYFSKEFFKNTKMLDFGCGCGASTMVLARMFQNTEIFGVELDNEFLSVARHRAKYYGFDNVRFFLSPHSNSLPDEVRDFDYIILNAVYEHLLPNERKILMPLLWSRIKRGGILFVNQTPHRWYPIESHTTGLPLINYFPDNVALFCARNFSKKIKRNEKWENLLRKGIRGGTAKDIISLLEKASDHPLLLEPQLQGVRDRIDLWYKLQSIRKPSFVKKFIMILIRSLKAVSGITLISRLNLAIKKP